MELRYKEGSLLLREDELRSGIHKPNAALANCQPCQRDARMKPHKAGMLCNCIVDCNDAPTPWTGVPVCGLVKLKILQDSGDGWVTARVPNCHYVMLCHKLPSTIKHPLQGQSICIPVEHT